MVLDGGNVGYVRRVVLTVLATWGGSDVWFSQCLQRGTYETCGSHIAGNMERVRRVVLTSLAAWSSNDLWFVTGKHGARSLTVSTGQLQVVAHSWRHRKH